MLFWKDVTFLLVCEKHTKKSREEQLNYIKVCQFKVVPKLLAKSFDFVDHKYIISKYNNEMSMKINFD